jgi:PmbA protein
MDDLMEIARKIAGQAGPGEQIEAYVVHARSTEVRALNGEIESLSSAEEQGIGIRVIADHRQGLAWAGTLDANVIDETLADARDNARFGAPDEFYGLATPADIGDVPVPDLDLWRAELADVPTDDKVALALALDAATRSLDPRVRGVESADYGDTMSEAALVSSTGIEASSRRTSCSVSSSALAGEGTGTQTGFGFSVGRAFADLDIDVAARDAVERATRLLGAAPTKSGQIAVIFDPLVTRSLLGIIAGALNGESVLKGRSMFADRVGEQIAAGSITLVDDPTLPEALGASTHDSEGMPTRRTELIVDGVLRRFLHNVYSARRAGTLTTGSAVRGIASTPGVGSRALHAVPGTVSPTEMLSLVPKAFYVQSISGIHSGVNPISGDFSVGADGLLVRDGAFAEPVREVTIASTLPRLLRDIAAVGSDLTWLPGGGAGLTLLVPDVQLSGR